jgi:hypothetical protein
MSVSSVEGPLYSDFPQDRGAFRKVIPAVFERFLYSECEGSEFGLTALCFRYVCTVASMSHGYLRPPVQLIRSLDELVHIVTRRLRAGIVEPEETSIARQLLVKRVPLIPFVKNEILRIAERYKAQTANHDNKLIEELYTKTSSINEIDYRTEKHHWMFPLQAKPPVPPLLNTL